MANYMDDDGSQLYGYGRWQTIRIWKVANYADNEGGQLYGIMKVANYPDNESGQLYG